MKSVLNDLAAADISTCPPPHDVTIQQVFYDYQQSKEIIQFLVKRALGTSYLLRGSPDTVMIRREFKCTTADDPQAEVLDLVPTCRQTVLVLYRSYKELCYGRDVG
jgi:hypothetical protein